MIGRVRRVTFGTDMARNDRVAPALGTADTDHERAVATMTGRCTLQ